MVKISLQNLTLMGIDCVDFNRLQKVADISMEGIDFADVKLLSSIKNSDPRWVEIDHIGSIEAFSEFCIKELTKYVDTDYVLLIQYDGFVINPNSWSDEFFNYDYVGAPWLIKGDYWFRNHLIPREFEGRNIVGNGGFSLRSRRFVQASAKLAEQGKFTKYHPEDIVLCAFHQPLLLNEGMRFAPYEVARKFSIEGNKEVYQNQFGFHSLMLTDISDWIGRNPQYGIRQIPRKKKQPKRKRHWLVRVLLKIKRSILRKS